MDRTDGRSILLTDLQTCSDTVPSLCAVYRSGPFSTQCTVHLIEAHGLCSHLLTKIYGFVNLRVLSRNCHKGV